MGVVFTENPDQTSEKAIKLYNHILNAHQIWNARIESKPPISGVWEIHKAQDLKNIDITNYQRTLQLLNELDLNQTITYSNSKGQPFSNTIRDVFFHIVNHSTYHRGQIATEFRNNGLEPLVTDYIFYKR